MRNVLRLIAISFSLALVGSPASQVALASEDATGTSSNLEAPAPDPSQIEMRFEEGSLAADVAGAPLLEVAKQLQEVTGATVVLAGDASGAKAPVWANVKPKPLDKALAELFKGFSYSSYSVAGSDLPKITIYIEGGEETSEPRPSVSADLASARAEELAEKAAAVPVTETSERAASESEEGIGETEMDAADAVELAEETADSESAFEAEAAYVPYDLDEVAELPPQPVSQNEDDFAEWDSRFHESRLNRSMSAIDSQHSHIRRMAVGELVSTKDPRATRGIVHAATREDASADERTLAAEALWRHAADLEFSSPSATQALRQLSTDSDPAVADVANRALADMERYQRQRR